MSNPNLISVWSPDGSEMIETSRANARDLVTHVGWSYAPPQVVEKIVLVEKDSLPEKESTDEVGKAQTETTPTAEDVTEAETATDEVEAEGTSPDQVVILTTEEEFEALESREDVVNYLAKAFPDFKPHHLAKRDGLVTKAIELAEAEAAE
jgi:hypothetical protein